jgi:hypothetical protein
MNCKGEITKEAGQAKRMRIFIQVDQSLMGKQKEGMILSRNYSQAIFPNISQISFP